MNISRSFLIAGAAYLLIGLVVGVVMGAMQDHTMMPLHAHINLLGFTLMTAFGLCYRAIPALGGRLGRLHFWLHQLGTLGMVIGLYLKYGPSGEFAVAEPLLIVTSFAVVAGGAVWLINLIGAPDRPAST